MIHKSHLDDTMTMVLEVKKWGNSLAVIIPKDFARKKNIKAKDKISTDFGVPADLREIFGFLRGKKIKEKMTAQEAKDLAREGWG